MNVLNSIEINNCKHFFLNENNTKKMYFIHSPFFVEEDYTVKHPLGRVYKPRRCSDTLIRFVKQPNNSTLMFRINEWNTPHNPYLIVKYKFKWKHILSALID